MLAWMCVFSLLALVHLDSGIMCGCEYLKVGARAMIQSHSLTHQHLHAHEGGSESALVWRRRQLLPPFSVTRPSPSPSTLSNHPYTNLTKLPPRRILRVSNWALARALGRACRRLHSKRMRGAAVWPVAGVQGLRAPLHPTLHVVLFHLGLALPLAPPPIPCMDQ